MKLALTGAVVAALALGGCGSARDETAPPGDGAKPAGSAAPVATKVDPCSLLTAAEVTEVIGDKVVSATAAGETCTYATDDSGGVEVDYVRGDSKGKMAIDRKVAATMAEMGQAAAAEGPAGAEVNAMMQAGGKAPPLGDEALFGANGQLSFRKGDAYVAITPPIMHSRISHSGNPLISAGDKQRMAVALAQRALAKLR